MPARRVADPGVVMSLRVPKSVARKWEVFDPDWRGTVRSWMIENAPRSLAEELAELDAARVEAALVEPESEEF
jgi:hypothetical protein